MNVWACFPHGLWDNTSEIINQKKLCRRFQEWHDASFRSSVVRLVLLGLNGFSDWQLVQVLVETCHLVPSQFTHRHPQCVPVRDKMLCPSQWAPSDRSRDRVLGNIASFSWRMDPIPAFLERLCNNSLASWSPYRLTAD